MRLDRGLGHLTYCTNIHPGETWPEVKANLERHLPAIKRQVAPDRPFGVGLRLSAIAARALRQPSAMDELRRLIAEHDLYLFTLNGFPYGPFHGRRVKEQVYQPDWQHEERLVYTDLLADLLLNLLPDDPDLEGSISTVPGTFKPLAEVAGATERIAENLIRHAAHLVRLRETSGRTIALAIEPEPFCLLETIEETVEFFQRHLLGDAAVRRLSQLTGLGPGEAEAALHRHLGVCYDVCHAAVEFEHAKASVERLAAAGIRIPKLQLSTALRLRALDATIAGHLRSFDEPVYLHQVVERRGDRLIRHLDLPDALARLDGTAGELEWRVHFHVPIFLAELEHFSTTQGFLREILSLHEASPISAHLEAETYTFDVLPEPYRRVGVASAIARELAWARQQLAA